MEAKVKHACLFRTKGLAEIAGMLIIGVSVAGMRKHPFGRVDQLEDRYLGMVEAPSSNLGTSTIDDSKRCSSLAQSISPWIRILPIHRYYSTQPFRRSSSATRILFHPKPVMDIVFQMD